MNRLPTICAAGALVGGVLLLGQSLPEPRKKFGASITGAFEGWFNSDKDARTFLIGYFNRNTEQELDIPIGPNNRIEPGGPDLGQPTHFLPGRRYGMFAIPVPKDFAQSTEELRAIMRELFDLAGQCDVEFFAEIADLLLLSLDL